MWTQVTHGQSVDDIMAKIGRELGIEFKEPSIAMALTYRTGEWLYDEHGSRLDKVASVGHRRRANCQRPILAQGESKRVS